MKKVYTKHLPYTNGHYADVYHEMTLNDGPIIRAVKVADDDYCAIEGSHRIAACHDQGKDLRLLVVTPDASEDLGEHWASIKATLPCYEFEHVFVMYERDFELPPKHDISIQHLKLMD